LEVSKKVPIFAKVFRDLQIFGVIKKQNIEEYGSNHL